MPLKSMTGFATADGRLGASSWAFDVRSVNGRSLDVRMRLPAGSETLEPAIRERVQSRLSRGNVTINLQVASSIGGAELRLNEAALSQVLAAAARVQSLTGAAAPTVEGLLALRGVLELVDVTETEVEIAARHAAMTQTFATALDAFIANRAAEGERLGAILSAHVDEIERLVQVVSVSPARKPEAIAAGLAEQISRLTAGTHGLDSDRLYQEAVLIATRADVEEELQRLTVHIAAARDLLADAAPVGRKFDFLTQEFNREANTLCSKANDPEISRAGLAMKVLIDQMREQVANIE
jgi:uncharacterized protein (TIGR00255 family)